MAEILPYILTEIIQLHVNLSKFLRNIELVETKRVAIILYMEGNVMNWIWNIIHYMSFEPLGWTPEYHLIRILST